MVYLRAVDTIGPGALLVAGAVYAVYAAFWVRFLLHLALWWRARRRDGPPPRPRSRARALALAGADVALFARLFMVNPALWFAEWGLHLCLLLSGIRHLRFVFEPVPAWVSLLQTPGRIAGWLLPLAAAHILVVRLLAKPEQYASPANLRLLALVFLAGATGVAVDAGHLAELVGVKEFATGIVAFAPAAVPASPVFLLHLALALLVALLLPSHVLAAPLVMLEARRRDESLHRILHEEEPLVR